MPFLPQITAFLASRFGLPLIVGLIGLVGVGVQQVRVWWLESDVTKAQAEVADAQARLQVEQANVVNLRSAIADQNAAVEKLKADAAAEADRRAAAARTALRSAPKTAPHTIEEMNAWLAGR